MQLVPIVISVGSNTGDSVSFVLKAMDHLRSLAEEGFLASSLFDTSPVDCPPGSAPFVNAVVSFLAPFGSSPVQLLDRLQSCERDFGRRPKQVHNEPRPLDLDLITFGTLRLTSERLTLPHPRAHLRRFVLEPLAEIHPTLILPGQQRTVAQILSALNSDEIVRRIPIL